MPRFRLMPLALVAAVALACGFALGSAQKEDTRVFEMRTYTTNEGKLADLNTRFRDHTCRLFRKHGMDLVGFWTPVKEEDGKENTLVYILAYPTLEEREASWKAFQDDPEWKKVYEESHKDGPLVKEVKSVFLTPADYSPIK